MKRFGWTLLLVAIPVFAGCNGGGTAKNEGSTPNQAQVASGANITQAAEVVAQFLDSFRKGDETTAGRLLTQAAIAEIKKNGLEISPPGSPDSSYKLGRTEYTDEDKDTAYVEVEWTETIEGSAEKKIYETLFAVRLENNQWRIAGMVIETDPILLRSHRLRKHFAKPLARVGSWRHSTCRSSSSTRHGAQCTAATFARCSWLGPS